MKDKLLITAIVLGASTAAPGQSAQQGAVVPAFFGLGTKSNGITYDWDRIEQAGSVAKIVVAGLDTIGASLGTTRCTGSPVAMFDCLRANKQIVFGYVFTNSAQRAQAYVLHGGDNQPSVDDWYKAYDGHIDGIFFDVGPDLGSTISEANQQAYYQAIYNYVTTNHVGTSMNPLPCGNNLGHACVMVNASQFPNTWVVSTTAPIADYLTIYERPLHGSSMALCPPNYKSDAQDYVNAFCPSGVQTTYCSTYQNPMNWYFDPANGPREAHIVFGVGSSSDINTIISASRSQYGTPGFVYVHDQDCGPNGAQYGRLPSYFEQLIGALNMKPAVASWGSGRLDLFGKDAVNALRHRWWDGGATGGPWSAWEGHGGTLNSSPVVVSWGAGRLDVFIRGTDNALWHAYWNGSSWSAWQSLGGVLTSEPAAVSWAAGRLDVFVRGGDYGMYHMWSTDGLNFSGWEARGGTLRSAPVAVSWGAGRLDVFARGPDDSLEHTYWNGSVWSGWQSLGGILSSEPAAVSWGAGRLDVFVRGGDYAMYHTWSNDGVNFSAWEPRGGLFTSAPIAVSWGAGRIDLFARGRQMDLQHSYWAGGPSWTAWQSLGGFLTSFPAGVSWGPSRLDVFVNGTDNGLWHTASNDGVSFSVWEGLH